MRAFMGSTCKWTQRSFARAVACTVLFTSLGGGCGEDQVGAARPPDGDPSIGCSPPRLTGLMGSGRVYGCESITLIGDNLDCPGLTANVFQPRPAPGTEASASNPMSVIGAEGSHRLNLRLPMFHPAGDFPLSISVSSSAGSASLPD